MSDSYYNPATGMDVQIPDPVVEAPAQAEEYYPETYDNSGPSEPTQWDGQNTDSVMFGSGTPPAGVAAGMANFQNFMTMPGGSTPVAEAPAAKSSWSTLWESFGEKGQAAAITALGGAFVGMAQLRSAEKQAEVLAAEKQKDRDAAADLASKKRVGGVLKASNYGKIGLTPNPNAMLGYDQSNPNNPPPRGLLYRNP